MIDILDSDGNVLAGVQCDGYDYDLCNNARNDENSGLVLKTGLLRSGNYYIRVGSTSFYGSSSSPPSMSYEVKASFSNVTGEIEFEPNDESTSTYILNGETIDEFIEKVNGMTISPKKTFCILKIWMRDLENQNPKAIIPIDGLALHGCLFKKHNPNF